MHKYGLTYILVHKYIKSHLFPGRVSKDHGFPLATILTYKCGLIRALCTHDYTSD